MISSRLDRSRLLVFASVVAVAIAIGTRALYPGESAAATMLAITLACVVLWILTPIPPTLTEGIAIGSISAAFSPEYGLAGFQSPATWLIGFGLLMGEATRRSGLAIWAREWITTRSVPSDAHWSAPRAYRRLLLGLCLGAHGLELLVPSTLVRVLILTPVLEEIGTRFDSRDARIGLFLGPLFATFYGSSGILTADLPNIIITGIGSSVGGHDVNWIEWAVHMYPVLGLTRVLVVAGVIYLLFRPVSDATVELSRGKSRGMEGTERRMLLFLLIGAAVWVTDFAHGHHPVAGAIIVVVLAALPRIGVVDFEAVKDADFSILFFVAAVLAIGEGLAVTGFADGAATYLLELVPSDAPFVVILAFVFFATVTLALLMEGLAVASVLTPVLVPYAESAGLPIEPVLMIEALALTTYFFPYQSEVLIVISRRKSSTRGS